MSFDLKLQNGTLSISNSGDLEIVEKLDKLIQDVLKIIITPLGSNIFAPWYGSSAANIIGNLLDQQLTSSLASTQIQTALNTLSKIQTAQARLQFLTPEEQIAAIRQVQVQQNSVDPRFIDISIDVINKALQSRTISLDASL